MRVPLTVPARGRDRVPHRPQVLASVVVAVLVVALISITRWAVPAVAASPCGASINPVTCENSQTTGVVDDNTWDVDGAGDSDIQGFATDISANAGSSIGFKIDTTLSYTINIYRLGYYGGSGARLWQANLTHSAPVKQPNCLTDASTLLYDCGDWSVGATWAIPSNAVSGVYIARLTATNGHASHITFIVRNDASTSAIVYQTSDETWQAYNTFGGSSFYVGTDSLTGSQARAFKISYNRPFATRDWNSGQDFLFSNEYPTIRFLERNGYDVTYISGVDADRNGALLLNHSTYMSVGHDEYWSGAQRANVENARDHGVNLMFLSGNEVYWHTRFEASIDGSNTSYRTLVCYKDTWDNAKIDPSPETTSTWRDPRFGTSPNSSKPENALTGTMYMSNSDDLAVTVTAAQGKMRLWRGTGLSTMSGASTALAPHTVGYESDEDVDNGFRPAGLVDLSTTVGSTPQYLQDFGLTVAPGTTTHHLTLYRASSGALVFGAGTIQWGWGLDDEHDVNTSTPADPRMQQATLNMLADMHAFPTTLMAGMVMPTASTDTQAPNVSITSPTAGSSIANGTKVTVSGTAADVGGGQVAGVEASLDGGTSWHPATGTTSWTYSGILHGTGASAIKVRATDDSANMSAAASVALTVNCPCSLFGSATPATPDGGDGSAVELGVRFSSSSDGYISGVRFYKASTNTGTHVGTLWNASGTLLATGTFTGESASGWQTLQFATPVAVTADTTYVASYYAPSGHYSADPRFFYYSDYQAAPLSAQTTTPNSSTLNGVFSTGHSFPSSSFQGANYYVDVLFTGSASVPPTVTGHTPSSDASSVATDVSPTVTFSKAMNSSTIAFTMTDASGNAVPGSMSYDAASKTAKFTPSAALTGGTLYSISVTGSDTNGNALASPFAWSFRTVYPGQVGGACPCTIFSDSSVPAVVTEQDPGSVELGVKFTADTDGIVTGVRFYKGPQNLGVHTGSLWSSTGTQLATANFSNESATGWQTVTFASPVSVTAGTTYVASYHTSVGYYSATVGAYASAGVDNFPLHVPVGGSVYTYSTAFPSTQSNNDYGVDVVFSVPASLVPTITASDPGSGDTNISTGTSITTTFNTSILGGTANVTLTPAGGSPVAGTATLDSVHKVLTFTPSAALAVGTAYTVSVSGARTLSGTAQSSPATWTFTTGGGGSCPCSLFASSATPATPDAGDAGAITLGVKVTASTAGTITGLRFYKSAANTGVHTGSVWNAAGVRLATVTFANETASGWQSASFSPAVPVTAGMVYTVGYYTPTGHYSATSHYFDSTFTNGVLSVPGGSSGLYKYGSDTLPTGNFANTNYWVDPVFVNDPNADTTPPTVADTNPIDRASSVSPAVSPSADFSEPVAASSVTFTLSDASGNNVGGSVHLDGAALTATFTPTNPLTAGSIYTATVNASDTAGNPMALPMTWSFTTANAATTTCPCSVWNDSATPAVITDPDGQAVELGVKFSADRTGHVVGVRFYKGPSNTGTHTGTLWSSDGVSLGTGTFSGESSTGWETLTFASPVAITAGTTYVVSYHTSTGFLSYTSGAFATSGVDNAPLHIPAHGGLYVYGSGGFPTNASDTNYWVDPVFQPDTSSDVTPPVISGVTATGSGTSATISFTTDEAGTTQVAYGTSATALTQSATVAGLGTTHSVQITGLASATTYYYRVTSADASGNSATAPAAASAPATYSTTDTVAPVVSAISVAPAGSGATVTWTTDEAATTRVDYGTSASALTSNATASGLVTAHSVALSGLSSGTTYYYRVTSADASGNSTTSPAAANAPATFTAADTVPPTITAVAASGSGTTASVTWTTNEASTSQVAYGTTTTSLTLSASATGSGTSHTVALTGLTANTRYYYRVTSVDPSGNSTTSPAAASAAAVYVPTTTPFLDSTTADFNNGTNSSTYVTADGDGGVVLAPSTATDFTATTIPSGWTSTATATGGTTTYAGGNATVKGSNFYTSATYSTAKSLEVQATLDKNQSIGWAASATSSTKLAVSVNSSNQLIATVNDGFTTNVTSVLATGWTPALHKFRIEWNSGSVTFYLDDVAKFTKTFSTFFTTSMRPVFSDTVVNDAALILDWVRVGPYAATGTYTSRVVNASAAVTWDGLTWDATVPTGTTLTVKVRTGNTATPDGTWTAYATIPASGGLISKTSRYLQYQLTYTSTGTRYVTPTVRSVQMAFHV